MSLLTGVYMSRSVERQGTLCEITVPQLASIQNKVLRVGSTHYGISPYLADPIRCVVHKTSITMLNET
jgi:hypothetical protein